MRRVLLLAFVALLIAACSGQPASNQSTATSLPAADLTSEASRNDQNLQTLPPPPLDSTTGGTHFDDMQPGGAEVAVLGDLLSIGTFPTSPDATITFTNALNAPGTTFPARQVIFNVDVRPGADQNAIPGRLDVILYVPTGVMGAQNVVAASNLTPQQFGVVLTLSGIASNFLDVSNQNMLTMDGDVRVLENDAAFSAAFDFTVTNTATSQSIRLIGRFNQLPFTP